MTRTAHTPLPWIVRLSPRSDDCFVQGPMPDGMAYAPEIMGDDYNGFGDNETKRADAEFIVRACNVHDDLVKALQDVSATLHQHDPMKTRILELLAKAQS